MWLATGNLLTVWGRMPIPGAEIRAVPCLLALAVARWPLCLQQGGGAYISQLAFLWYFLNPLFCERTRLEIRAFRGKVLSLLYIVFFFFFSWRSQFGLLFHISFLRSSSGIQSWVLPRGPMMLLMPPCPAPTRWWWMRASGTSPLADAVRHIFCGFCFFLFPTGCVAL